MSEQAPQVPFAAPPSQRELPHTRFGIASFALASCAGIAIGTLIAFVGVLELVRPNALDRSEFAAALVGLAFLAAAGLELLALALGIAGWAQRDRKKAFAVLGVVFSGLPLLVLALLVFLGSD